MLKKKLTIVTMLMIVTGNIYAQDANYWNNQYGPGGYVLPGAVIADNSDSGVLYINPALLVNSKITLLSANATVYHLDRIVIKNGAGTGFNLTSNSSGALPAMIAGNFQLPLKNKKIIIAYGIIQPHTFSFASSQRRDEKFNVLNNQYSPGTEYFVGQYLNQNNEGNFNVLASAGWRVSDQLSAGVTLEGSLRTQTINLDYYARAIVNPGGNVNFSLVGTDVSYYATYSHVSLIPKAGFAWDLGKNHAGILLSFPNLRLWSKGTLLSDDVISNIDLTETGKYPLSFFGNSRQENLPAKWKMPLSLAAAYTHDFENWQLYVSAEYFNRISEYNIITPRDDFFIRPDTGNSYLITPDLLKLKDARKAILNTGLGASFRLNEKHTLYVAARTDFTYADSSLYDKFSDGFTYNTTVWNLYHFQFGVNLKRLKYNLRAGVYTSVGATNKYNQGVNFDDPNESNFLQGRPGQTKAKYFSIGIMVSYIHNR